MREKQSQVSVGTCLVVQQLLTQKLLTSSVNVEFIGYVGGSYDKFYGELSAVTNEDLVDWGAKAGVKFTF